MCFQISLSGSLEELNGEKQDKQNDITFVPYLRFSSNFPLFISVHYRPRLQASTLIIVNNYFARHYLLKFLAGDGFACNGKQTKDFRTDSCQ